MSLRKQQFMTSICNANVHEFRSFQLSWCYKKAIVQNSNANFTAYTDVQQMSGNVRQMSGNVRQISVDTAIVKHGLIVQS